MEQLDLLSNMCFLNTFFIFKLNILSTMGHWVIEDYGLCQMLYQWSCVQCQLELWAVSWDHLSWKATGLKNKP